MNLQHVREKLDLQHRRISSQISLISHLRNDGRFQESERACWKLDEMLDTQSRLFGEFWRAQEQTRCTSRLRHSAQAG